MVHVIVEESFSKPLAGEEASRLERRIDEELSKAGARWLRTFMSKDQLREICEFEAPDVDVVRRTFEAVGIKPDRVWAAEVSALS